MLHVTAFIEIPLREFEFSFARSSGPGGQNVNKVNSKAVMRWSILSSPSLPEPVRQRFLENFPSRLNAEGEVLITSDRFRDQQKNIDDCLEKLREMLLQVAVPPKPRKATKPTRSAKRRRLNSKRMHSEKKQNRKGSLS